MDELKKKVGAMLTHLKEEKPLVHCISNYVTINDGVIRHNVEKLSLDIYSYLVNE